MAGVRSLYRGPVAKGYATANSAPIRVDDSSNVVKVIPAGSGSTEIALVDATTAQTVTSKTLIPTITTQAVDAAIAVTSDVVVLTKGSAAAMTLAAPATIGKELEIYAGSAFAHVVTATGLIDDGVTGGSKTTLTFGAFIGASIVLRCVQTGKWAVKAKNVVTIT